MPLCNAADRSCDITPRESAPTSPGSSSRENQTKRLRRELQIKAQACALSTWKRGSSTGEYREVEVLGLRRVLHGAFGWLEPCAVKVACTVLRGGGGGNAASLTRHPRLKRRNVEQAKDADWPGPKGNAAGVGAVRFPYRGQPTLPAHRGSLNRILSSVRNMVSPYFSSP